MKFTKRLAFTRCWWNDALGRDCLVHGGDGLLRRVGHRGILCQFLDPCLGLARTHRSELVLEHFRGEPNRLDD